MGSPEWDSAERDTQTAIHRSVSVMSLALKLSNIEGWERKAESG
jgi:hypothetical protein